MDHEEGIPELAALERGCLDYAGVKSELSLSSGILIGLRM